MNNAIITNRKDRGPINLYARFDRYIDRYKTFATVKPYNLHNSVLPILRLTRKQMNYMLIRSAIYKIPARPTHL